MMKAAVLHAPGDLRIENVPIAKTIPQGSALIKVHYAGICGSDLDRVMKTGTYSFPTIPGHEFCGEIAHIKEDSTFKKGDRVVVAPIIPCYKCDSCQQGNYGLCDSYNYLGSRADGGFAEYVVAPIENLIRFPDKIDFRFGAMVEPAAVTLHGIMRTDIQAGDTAVVLGCGPIGLFAVRFAKLMGATHIIATDLEEEKLETAVKLGATTVINSKKYNATDEIIQLTKGKGADVVIETAGVSITQVQSITLCKKQGKILYLGTAHKDVVIPPEVFEHIIRRELNITGSWNSFSAPFPGREWHAVIDYIENGSLPVELFISHEISLDDLPDFIAKMAARSFPFNKVIVQL